MWLLLVVSSSVVVSVHTQALQRIVEEPKDVRVLKGNNATLRCGVENQQGPLQWTKDGFGLGTDRSLSAFPRYSMVGSSADGEYHLDIQRVELSDDAPYRCLIGSTATQKGVMSKPSRLVVLVTPQPPAIVNNEDLISTVEERAFTVSCAVNGGKPAASIHWVVANKSDGTGVIRSFVNPKGKKEQIITEKTENDPEAKGLLNVRSNLRYSPLRDDDGKFLVCVAKHEAIKGAMTAASLLNVEYAPRVKVTMEGAETDKPDVVLKEGASATLLCTADAKPADNLRYSWKRDGSAVKYAHGRRLVIESLQPFHNGAEFQCEVTNTVGSGKGATTTSLAYGPRMPAEERLAVDVGDSVTLSCPADGNPTPVIKWTKVGAPDNVLGQGVNYTMSSLTSWQQGSYQCEAEVPGFPKASTSFTIHINGAPHVYMDASVEGAEGDTTEVICDVRGFPFPTAIAWWKGHRRLDMKEHPNYELRQLPQAEGVVSILSIRAAEPDDFDVFNCTATNSYGTHSATTRLNIANPFPLYIMIPCLIGGFVLLCILVLCIVLCSRRSFCSAKSSHRSGDSHSDVTVKVEALDGVPMNSYYATEIYSPPSVHPQDISDSYGRDYLPIPQDNPDLDVLPPPYSNYGHVSHPSSNIYHYGNGGPPPSTSTFRDPPNERLVHMTYMDDRNLLDEAASPILYTDEYGNIVGSDYGAGYGQQYWHPSTSQYQDAHAVYYPSHGNPHGVSGGLGVLEELPTPVEEGRGSRVFRPSPLPDQASPTTQTSAAGSSGGSSTGPILSGLNDSGLPPSSLNSTNV